MKYTLLLTTIISFISINIWMSSCAQNVKTIKTDDELNTANKYPEKSKYDAYYNFAISRLNLYRKNFTGSLKSLEKAEQADPESPYLKFNLALLYLNSNQIDKALEKLNESIENDGNYAQSYTLLGKIHGASKDKKKIDKSIKLLKKAIVLNPEDTEAYLTLGIIYAKQNNEVKANEYFTKILQIDPRSEKANYFLARLNYFKGNLKEAERLYKEALSGNPYSVPALLELAIVYEKLGDTESSEQIYKELLHRCE